MAFTPDIRLCVYHCLEEYIQRTEKLRSDDGQLFISFNKPRNKVSRETVRRWIKNVMVLAGIDVNHTAQDRRQRQRLLKRNSHYVKSWRLQVGNLIVHLLSIIIRRLLSEVQTMLINFYRVSLKIGLRKVLLD